MGGVSDVVGHSALAQALRRCGVSADEPPSSEQWQALLVCLDEGYTSADQELNASLEAERARLLQIVVNSQQAMVYCGPDFDVRLANDSAQSLIGPIEGPLTSCVTFLRDNHPFTWMGHEVHTLQGSIQTATHRFDASWHFAPVHVDGKIDGILIEFSDLRELRKQQAAIQAARLATELSRRADAARSGFLANVSHELRTPMNAILGYTELLHEDAEGALGEDLGRILHASGHLLTLIDNLLDLSSIDAGRMVLELQPIVLESLLDEVVTAALPLIQEGDNEIYLSCELGTVYTDPTRLAQCLLNLLGNAAKFTENGTIQISAYADEEWLCIDVADDGAGIDEEELARIFNVFETPLPSGSRGPGVGLTLTSSLLQRMGGELVASSASGEGSTFTIRLPAR